MAKSLSMDIRERAMRRLASGESTRHVAAALEVAVSSVVKWSQRMRATGSVAPAKRGGRRPPVLKAEDRIYICNRLAAEPEATLRGLQAELAARGVRASYGAIWNFVHAERLSFKKNRRRRRAVAAGRRAAPKAMEKPSAAARS